MIAVQINTPQSHNTQLFDQANLQQKWPNLKKLFKLNLDKHDNNALRGPLKPSKSSANLNEQDYERYFTVAGRNTFTARLERFLPPIDFKIVVFCLIWYFLSAISSNISKNILSNFPHPTSFTEIQFLVSCFFCVLTVSIVHLNQNLISKFPVGVLPKRERFKHSKNVLDLIFPTEKILKTTAPMGMFQFIGHITSHKATSIIPVSLVHSVKALSPLSTVLCYKFLFKVQYPMVTYLTLLPLMIGVIMTCFSSKISTRSNENFHKGLIYAFISMMIFVSQNIFAKKILTIRPKSLPVRRDADKEKEDEEKIDKITILLYCSLIGFVLTLPIYLFSEFSNDTFSFGELNIHILGLLILHGVSHFCQSLLAFHIIGLVSPVNYSIANILKRIVVISMAIVLERSEVSLNQGIGLVLTMVGLYSYDRWGMVKK